MPVPAGAGSMRIPSVARNGFPGPCRISSAVPVPDGPFDADRRRFPEADLDPVLGRQGGLDHLLLDLAVQGDVDFLPDVVLADVDERVLLGELGDGGVQPRLVARVAGHHGGLQRRRREVVLIRVVRGRPDRVADLDSRQARQPGDLAGGHLIAACRGAVGEDADRGYLAVAVAAEPHAIPGRDRAGEHADVRDLVTGGPAFDLEDTAGDRAVCVLVRLRAAGR